MVYAHQACCSTGYSRSSVESVGCAARIIIRGEERLLGLEFHLTLMVLHGEFCSFASCNRLPRGNKIVASMWKKVNEFRQSDKVKDILFIVTQVFQSTMVQSSDKGHCKTHQAL